MTESYIVDGAKEAQKNRMIEQVANVHHKVKKWADKIQTGGYEPLDIKHKEGDVWIERDEEWTIKNGIKQNIPKMDYSQVRMPLFCPKCENPLNHRLHKKFYNLRGACHDCVVQYEGKMRIDGVWDAYERRVMRNNEKSWIQEKIAQQEDFIKNTRSFQLHFSDGRWEEYVNRGLFENAFLKAKLDNEFLTKRLEQLEKEVTADDKPQQQLLEWERINPWK